MSAIKYFGLLVVAGLLSACASTPFDDGSAAVFMGTTTVRSAPAIAVPGSVPVAVNADPVPPVASTVPFRRGKLDIRSVDCILAGQLPAAYVFKVLSGSPLLDMLQVGDRVHSLSGQSVVNSADLTLKISRLPADQSTRIEVVRAGKIQSFDFVPPAWTPAADELQRVNTPVAGRLATDLCQVIARAQNPAASAR